MKITGSPGMTENTDWDRENSTYPLKESVNCN